MQVLISEEQINNRIIELAEEIMKDYENKEIIVISILNGAVYFTVDLTKRIKNDIILEFMQVSSYENGIETTGIVKMKKDISIDINGKDVLIIEDIIDTGTTLKYLKEYLKLKRPNSIKICTMLDKKERRKVEIEPDYIGFSIPNKFVVGYGLDNEGKNRNLPYIGYIE